MANPTLNSKDDATTLTKRLRSETKRELTTLTLGSAAMVASSAANQALPTLMGRLIDQRSKGNNVSNSTIIDTLGPSLAVVVLGGGLASFVRTYSLKVAQERIAVRLRKQAFSSLVTRDLEWFQVGTVNEEAEGQPESRGLSPGAIEEVLTEDVETIAKSRTTTLANIVRSCSSVLFSAYHMLNLDATLFGVSLGVVPLLGAAATLLRRSIKKLSLKQGLVATSMASFVEERLTHINVVQMANRENDEIDSYTKMQDESFALSRRCAMQEGMFMGFLFSAMSSGLLVVVNIGGKSVANKRMTSGELTSFATYSFLLGLGTSGLMRGLNELSQSMVAAERYYRLVSSETERESVSQKKSESESVNGSREVDLLESGSFSADSVDAIAFRNVSFTYQSTGTKVLEQVSFELQRGQIVALVGKNGSGKSTIAGLLAGLYRPQAGQIESSDGTDLVSLNAACKKTLVQIVPQSVALFNTSILENVRYYKKDASEDQVRRALGLANCDEFVDGLEGGMDFVVGRNGDKLSGGERQRLALARALLSEPSFLILDEPGSSLDAQGESAVNDALDACRNGKQSLLLITHNAKNLDHADMVLVLDRGRIVEAGQVVDLKSNPNSALMKLMPDLTVRS